MLPGAIAVLIAILFYFPMRASAQLTDESVPAKATILQRIEALSKQESQTMTTLPERLITDPMFKRIYDELSAELRSDLPKIRDEVQKQLSDLLRGKKKPSPTP